MSALVHPADGLYATSVDRLWQVGACLRGRRAFSAAAARINGRAPGSHGDVRITLRLLHGIAERYRCLPWLIDQMRGAEHISYSDWSKAHDALAEAFGSADKARVVMDLLLTRAKREGLVAK